ncbi:MAG: nucleoid-associated protein Lsr2 [Acidobacteria bacterium]|nr:MAG: nucleoid-associated protein Lsr2 [Acidobacteriota bacterium]
MAQKIRYILISDLSGEELGEDGQTIKFGFLGVDYEMDLSADEADEFTRVMQKYVDNARRVGGRRQAARNGSSASGDRTRLAQIREWARANGMEVASRGRIAQDVIDAYEAAH